MPLRSHIKPLLFLFLLTLIGMSAAIAQNEANPFDLNHRIIKKSILLDSTQNASDNPFDIEAREEAEEDVKAATEAMTKPAPATQNPFDIQRIKPGQQSKRQEIEKPVQEISKKKIKKPTDTRSGFLFWMILSMMVLLALLVTLYRSLIGKIYRAFTNENILKLLQREQSIFISVPYLFLYLLFFISGGIFIFQVAYHYDIISFEYGTLLYCILGLAGFFLAKHLVLKIIEIVFPISKEVKQYSFTIVIFSIILGIILTPFNIFIAFAQDSLTYPGIIGAFLAVIAVYLFRTLRGIFIGSKFLAFHKFHFFMYICIVEIAPCIILIKLLLNGANIQ